MFHVTRACIVFVEIQDTIDRLGVVPVGQWSFQKMSSAVVQISLTRYNRNKNIHMSTVLNTI